MADTSPVWSDLAVNLAAAAVWALAVAAAVRLRRFAATRRPLYRVSFLLAASAVFVLLNILIRDRYPPYADLFLAVSTTTLAAGWYFEIRQFWQLGIVGVGTDGTPRARYERALALCRDSLEFLGIGAGKLTAAGDAFTAAIDRCHRENRPIRFLLSSPRNSRLITIARQANRPKTEYQEAVRSSLRVLKHLKEQRGKNIEVRLYDDLPVFRLMFVNGELCLASHYVMGEGDGSQLPDVYLRRQAGDRDVNSIYHGFRLYFDQLWERAEPWDFKSLLD